MEKDNSRANEKATIEILVVLVKNGDGKVRKVLLTKEQEKQVEAFIAEMCGVVTIYDPPVTNIDFERTKSPKRPQEKSPPSPR